jgi:hypothetical protein
MVSKSGVGGQPEVRHSSGEKTIHSEAKRQNLFLRKKLGRYCM